MAINIKLSFFIFFFFLYFKSTNQELVELGGGRGWGVSISANLQRKKSKRWRKRRTRRDDGGLNYCFLRSFSHLHESHVLSFILARSLSRSADVYSGGGGRSWEERGGA